MTHIPLSPYKITTDDITGPVQRGEYLMIDNFIKPGHVVFDIGANLGKWSNLVLSKSDDVHIHMFEPVPDTFHKMIFELPKTSQPVLHPNHMGVGAVEELKTFYFYEDRPMFSTFYRRFDVERKLKLKEPRAFPVLVTTIDRYCERLNIPRIDFLKIDTEGGELACLQGARRMLKKGMIDYIQFEYGGTYLDAKITLQSVYELLHEYRYQIFKVMPDGILHTESFQPSLEDYQYGNFLAVNERLVSRTLGKNPSMLDLSALTKQYELTPRGVIHIGAHEGRELEKYRSIGIRKVLFIEANPDVYQRLIQNVGEDPDITCINCAIGNYNGSTSLHVTSMDQSSSILPLKRHLEIYPKIHEVDTIHVPMKTLDSLVEELQLDLSQYNMLSMDIQGAEHLALQGALKTLASMDMINTEVNYAELYEGCATIDQLDSLLEEVGFTRVAVTTPFHPSWGDAFYARSPVVTMSNLGQNGRFANQLFQYAFLKMYTEKFNLRLELPEWKLGEFLYNVEEPRSVRPYPSIKLDTQEHEDSLPLIACEHVPYQNVDFDGFFQYHTKHYLPFRDRIVSLLQPTDDVRQKIQPGIDQLHARGKTIVALHLRRGDYGYSKFQIAPPAWYLEWLEGFWDTLDHPVLYIASDDLDQVVEQFRAFSPVCSRDFSFSLPDDVSFYFDFHVLSIADFTAISNSSFSFAACMLNQSGTAYFRPHHGHRKLIPFQPWNSEVLLKDSKMDVVRQTIDSIQEEHLIIYGAGEHTDQLFRHTSLLSKNILFIVDKRASELNSPKQDISISIKPLDALEGQTTATVLISSFAHQEQIEQELIEKYHFKGKIMKLYDEYDRLPFYR